MNKLFYGDNLDVLRKYVKDESVDLCYIDPPFNSKRNYNQIYNNIGDEDRAQAQAFVDTWAWNDRAIDGLSELLENPHGRFPAQTVDLIKGLHSVLGKGSLLAYLISMTLRLAELHRALKPTGTLFLHCDPVACHYLKLVLDSVFCSRGGHFLNEIIWFYGAGGRGKKWFGRKHDNIFFYSKGKNYTFNGNAVRVEMKAGKSSFGGRLRTDEDGRTYREVWGTGRKKLYKYYLDEGKIPEDVWEIPSIQSQDRERLGYPTQKPEDLLERIIRVGSNECDVVLDAYCGCGTTIAMAQRLGRQWIGIDITYQSISLMLWRLENEAGKDHWGTIERGITLHGIPKDIQSAKALATKKDDRVRKEFEKWAVLTYTNNRAIVNEKKGADGGIDGTVYFLTGPDTNSKMVLQAKSGGVDRGDIAKFRGDMEREEAALATFITLDEPSPQMISEAKCAGHYYHGIMGRYYDKIRIVTVQEMLDGQRMDLPLSRDVVPEAAPVGKLDMAGGLKELSIPGIDPAPHPKRSRRRRV